MNAMDQEINQPHERGLAESRSDVAARRVAYTSAVIVALIGCIGLTGWLFDIAVFRSIVPGLAAMKFNTALTLLLIAISLLQLGREPVSLKQLWLGRVAASVAAIVAAITLAEYGLDLNFGIDEIAFRDRPNPLEPPQLYPGRMAPLTALSLLLISAGLLLEYQMSASMHRLAQALAIAGGASAHWVLSAISTVRFPSTRSGRSPVWPCTPHSLSSSQRLGCCFPDRAEG